MISKTLASLSLIGLVSWSAGCQTSGPIVRGQSPAPQSGGMAYHPVAPAPGPMYYDGPAGAHSKNCPPQHCHPNGAQCPLCAPQNFWVPTHHHTYDYKQPKNLVYPPRNQPAGVVVYPYYTCKGPTDFFMK